MKSVEQQQAVTQKVQDTFAEFPSLDLVPMLRQRNKEAVSVKIEKPMKEQQYVAALYELFYQAPDSELAGQIDGVLEASIPNG